MTEDFATMLRRLMAQRGLTVRELARRVPCTHSYLSMLSSGKRRHPSPEVAERLDRLLGTGGELAEAAGLPGYAPLSRDYETWADDLERATVYASRQNFAVALTLSGRWLNRFPVGQLDPKGLYLHARSLVVLGDIRRDQGALLGAVVGTPQLPARAADVQRSGHCPADGAGQAVVGGGR